MGRSVVLAGGPVEVSIEIVGLRAELDAGLRNNVERRRGRGVSILATIAGRLAGDADIARMARGVSHTYMWGKLGKRG